jgi:hypothetical protein
LLGCAIAVTALLAFAFAFYARFHITIVILAKARIQDNKYERSEFHPS